MSDDEDRRLQELESQLRNSFARREDELDRHGKARIARRLGLPPQRRRRWRAAGALLAALLVVILMSLIWLGGLTGGRPSPTEAPVTSRPSVERAAKHLQTLVVLARGCDGAFCAFSGAAGTA